MTTFEEPATAADEPGRSGRSPRSRRANPEGRMALREHLQEVRKRAFVSALVVLVAGVAGWFIFPTVFDYLTAPIQHLQHDGRDISINFGLVGGALDLRLKLSLVIGIIISSPIWLYQLWAFITPGLTRKERGYTLGFLGAAVPLFLAGVYLATIFVPNAMDFFINLTPTAGSNIIQAQDYLGFYMRTALAFGVAFVLPVVLVALNFTGLLPGRTVLKAWRWVTVAVFIFAAIATPTPDITSMLELAFPMLLLFAIAIAICLLNDRRRARRAPEWGAEISDDEASAL